MRKTRSLILRAFNPRATGITRINIASVIEIGSASFFVVFFFQ